MDKLIYTKYSTDRNEKFAIRTDRMINESGIESIKKVALSDEGIPHLQNMVSMCEKLQKRYGDKIIVSKSSMEGRVLSNELVEGQPYFELFYELIDSGDRELILKEYNNYRSKVLYSDKELELFESTSEFAKVFGENDVLKKGEYLSADVTDIDMIFENIIVSESGQWQLIDYEWTFDFPIPQEFVLYRALVFLYQKTSINEIIPWEEMMKSACISLELEKCFEGMEKNFSKYVTKGMTSLEQNLINSTNRLIPLKDLSAAFVFYDEGVWYRDSYVNLNGQYKDINARYNLLKSDYDNYKKVVENDMADYNSLKDLYATQQYELDRYRRRPFHRIRVFLVKSCKKIYHMMKRIAKIILRK